MYRHSKRPFCPTPPFDKPSTSAGVPVPLPLSSQPTHARERSLRHAACGAAMHAARARYRCRRAGAVSTGRACVSGALRKPVAGAARGGSERCCMQRGKQQRSVLGDVMSEMTALWRCLTACCRQAPFLLMLDDHMSSNYPTMGCLTTTCRRVSCNRMLDGCVSHNTPGAMLDDYLPSSDLLHVCLTTCCGCAVSVTALADVVRRAGGRCLMARCRRVPWRDVLDDMESESTCYSRT